MERLTGRFGSSSIVGLMQDPIKRILSNSAADDWLLASSGGSDPGSPASMRLGIASSPVDATRSVRKPGMADLSSLVVIPIEDAQRQAMAQFLGPCAIIAKDLTISSLNESAQRILEHGDRLRGGVGSPLRVSPHSLNEKFSKVVVDVLNGFRRGVGSSNVLVCDRSGEPIFALLVSPIHGKGGIDFALVRLVEFSTFAVDVPAMVMSTFGLTDREFQFVRLFAQAHSMKEIALAMHISCNTTRVHLRNVMLKTGAHSQVDLLRRISKFPPASDLALDLGSNLEIGKT